MQFLAFLLVSFVLFAAAYRIIGRQLVRIFGLKPDARTPAVEMRDGIDYEPIRPSYLLPQHFSAIAAAGPIVGPILAGLYFGWGPAWLWILFGSILIGGIHDFTALVASIKHRARSVAEIVRKYMNPRAYLLFLLFIWFALIYVIVAFTDVTAGAFIQKPSIEGGDAPGAAVATSSAIYLLLAVGMGFALRFTRISPVRAKLIFLPLVFAAIVAGPYLPLDLAALTGEGTAQQAWGYILLGYCFFAALAPVWSLLQPRGELGGYFLYIVMIMAVLGIVIGALQGTVAIEQPFFKGWDARDSFGMALPLFPFLFITVACGACSGFHSIVASGTTSKQLTRETDAKPVAYGSMLLEGFLACLSLATLMILSADDSAGKKPDWIYSNGIADFGTILIAPLIAGLERIAAFAGWTASDPAVTTAAIKSLLYQFALLCFATFVFDTLDACTRLARYVFMELFGWRTRIQAVIATLISLLLPVIAVSMPRLEFEGRTLALWQVFWNIFGSSNQLLAALTLLGVTVWMARRGRPYWIALGPTLFMMVMTMWSLALQALPWLQLFRAGQSIAMLQHFQFAIVLSLLVLSAWLVVEAIITWLHMKGPDSIEPEPEPEPA